jgi:E3 ubiquitin-protein ligase SIAH1
MAANLVFKSESQIRIDMKKELHIELYDLLVCQNCEAVPKTGPIYTCESSKHATCNSCFHKAKICKCKADIKYRNAGLAKVRTTLPLSCKYRKNGCNAVLTLEALLCHEVDCQWRPIFCPILWCSRNHGDGVKIIFNMLDNHLTEHHTAEANDWNGSFMKDSFNGITEDDLKGKKSQGWELRKLTLNVNVQFFLVMTLINKRFFIFVYYCGAKEKAKNYICSIKVYGSDNEEFIYNGHPRSLDEADHDIIDSDHGLILSLSQAKRCVSNEGKMKYYAKIASRQLDEDVESGIFDNKNSTSNN